MLFRVSALRRRAYLAGLSDVVVMGSNLRITPLDLPDSKQVRLTRLHPNAKYVPTHRVVTIPLPDDGRDLVTWVNEIFDELVTS
jgi:transcription-repair coupling factor (superfamily II helicase)